MYEPLRCHCGDYKCNNPVLSALDSTDEHAIDPKCILCDSDMCKDHAHFVTEVNRIRRSVCDDCYRVCMMAYENKQKGQLMQQKVAEFIANLLGAGLGREKIAERAYEYALALCTDNMADDVKYVSALLMAKASELVRDAMPEAYKINHERCMVRPIPPTVQIHIDPEAVRHAFRKSESEDE